MGLFDRVWVRCPTCGERVEFQSKAGECSLHDYTLTSAPPKVLADLHKEVAACSQGHVFTLIAAVGISVALGDQTGEEDS